MRRYVKPLAVILALCYILSAASALAMEEGASEALLKQASRKLTLYSEPSKKSDKLGSLARNTPVFAIDLKNGFSAVHMGASYGYAETKYLIAANMKTTAQGIAELKGDAMLMSAKDAATKLGALRAGQVVTVILGLGDVYAIRVLGQIGLVYADDLLMYDSKTPAIAQLQALKQTDIKNGLEKKALRIARAKKNERIELLKTLESGGYIVRRQGVVGIADKKNIRIIQDQAEETPLQIEKNAAALIAAMNAYRAKEGKKALVADETLMEAANLRVEEITRSFSHTRPNGSAPNSIHMSILAENIGRGNILYTGQHAADAFMGSPEHRKAAMNAQYKKTGAAYMRVGDMLYWVQLFG